MLRSFASRFAHCRQRGQDKDTRRINLPFDMFLVPSHAAPSHGCPAASLALVLRSLAGARAALPLTLPSA
eukprot:2929574-Alexandrium_andersonii.AAC.1